MPDRASRNGWRSYRFEEMATMVNDRIDNPVEAGVERYVGLEHLDADSLTIRRWGSPGDVTATKLLFRKGDIIFGRRRVYQRKLALADFNGICSAHAMVLRAKSEVALPEFLPFFMQSDLFMERAKAISVGSLSPTINWKTLAKEEFALPSLEEQRRIADVAIAASTVVRRHYDAGTLLRDTADSLLRERLTGVHLGIRTYHTDFGFYSRKLPLTCLGDLLLTTQYGISKAAADGGGYPMLRMMNLSDGLATDDDLCFVDLSEEDFSRYRLAEGDVLFNRTNSHDLVGRTGVYRLKDDHVFASYLIRLKADTSKLLPNYLCAFLNHPVGRRQVMRFATRGVSQSNVNADSLRRMLIPLPSLDYQEEVMGQIDGLRAARIGHEERVAKVREVALAVVNNCLGAQT